MQFKEKDECIVCKKITYPYGYVNKGKNQVCCRTCDEQHKQDIFNIKLQTNEKVEYPKPS